MGLKQLRAQLCTSAHPWRWDSCQRPVCLTLAAACYSPAGLWRRPAAAWQRGRQARPLPLSGRMAPLWAMARQWAPARWAGLERACWGLWSLAAPMPAGTLFKQRCPLYGACRLADCRVPGAPMTSSAPSGGFCCSVCCSLRQREQSWNMAGASIAYTAGLLCARLLPQLQEAQPPAQFSQGPHGDQRAAQVRRS